MRGGVFRWAAIGIVGAAVVLAVVLASRFGDDPGLVESPLLGKPAPLFQLETLEADAIIDLVELRGQIVVVNFWASWCLECRKEHDDLVATAEAFADDDVQFVLISYQEAIGDSLAFLDENGRSDATYYLADEQSRTAIAYGVFGIPETFFIDAEGTVVGKVIGETDALMIGATIDAIKIGEDPGQTITGDTQQNPE